MPGSMPGSPMMPPIVPRFLQSSRQVIQKKFIDLEWQQRHRLAQGSQSQDQFSQWVRLSSPEILKRNRYLDIDPWSNNRIHLEVPEGQNDYINASPISLTHTKSGKAKEYIATQGPKEYSLSHLWRMVWQETDEVGIIVMLTQIAESGREKCYPYYPSDANNPTLRIGSGVETSEDNPSDDFHATVDLLESEWVELTRSTLRKLRLTSGNESKIIWHYLFEGWPDFATPEDEDREALLRLIQDSSLKAVLTERPRIVHCSAGVGRTGTFIALDYLLDELKDGSLDAIPDDKDPIAECVDELRKQRMLMVQGELQFSFLYGVLKEQWSRRHSIISD